VRFLLDTDVISVLQLKSGDAFSCLMTRIAAFPRDEFGISIVSFHEQVIGAHSFIQAARTGANLERGYRMLFDILTRFSKSQVILFDADIDTVFGRLRKQRVRIGTMDLRIASIALVEGATVLTANATDFEKVPGLTIDDWTR
jgi:tRNA(fMet)-specific endonuclease VapC